MVSANTIKFTIGPAKKSTLSPAFKVLKDRNVPDSSHLSIKRERRKSLWLFFKINKPVSSNHAIYFLRGSILFLCIYKNIFRKFYVKALTKRNAVFRLIFCVRIKVSKTHLWKLHTATWWPLGMKNQILLSRWKLYFSRLSNSVYFIKKLKFDKLNTRHFRNNINRSGGHFIRWMINVAHEENINFSTYQNL